MSGVTASCGYTEVKQPPRVSHLRRFLKFVLFLLLLPVVLVVGVFWAPPESLARWVERGAERFADLQVDVESFDVAWFSEGPGIAVKSFRLPPELLDGEQAEAVLDISELLSGQLLIDHITLSDTRLMLSRDEQGVWNWQEAFASSGDSTEQPADSEEATVAPGIPAIRQIDITDVTIGYDDAVLARQATAVVGITGSTTDPDRPTSLAADGELDGLPVNMDVVINPLTELSSSLDDLALKASATVGDAEIALDGTIGNPSALSDLDMTFSAEAPDLQDMEVLAGVTLPTLPPWRVAGEVRRDAQYWVLERFDGKVGDSDLEGDFRIDPTSTPLEAYANLISRTLDLDDFAGLLGGVPDPDESATAEQQEVAETREEDNQILSDEPIALAALTEYFTGAVEYRAEEVRSPVWPIESLDTRVEVNAGKADVTRLKIGAAEGVISGTASLDANQQPTTGEFELEVNAVNLQEIMEAIGIDDDSFGRIGGNVRYWFEGDSVADIAASLDGGMFLLMTEGKLDALLLELAGIDVVETLFLLIDPGKTLATLECAYLDLSVEDGVADISRLVLDSSDTVFVGDGQIDLNDESLDVAVEPYPKDTSLISAQSSARVRGTVGDIQVLPGEELVLRAASAAILSTLVTPIAALLPLVQPGEGEDSAYCDGLISALDDATEADE